MTEKSPLRLPEISPSDLNILIIRAEGRTRTDNIIITNDSQLPIVLHRQNAELLTDMTGTQQGEKVFNLHAYYYAT